MTASGGITRMVFVDLDVTDGGQPEVTDLASSVGPFVLTLTCIFQTSNLPAWEV